MGPTVLTDDQYRRFFDEDVDVDGRYDLPRVAYDYKGAKDADILETLVENAHEVRGDRGWIVVRKIDDQSVFIREEKPFKKLIERGNSGEHLISGTWKNVRIVDPDPKVVRANKACRFKADKEWTTYSAVQVSLVSRVEEPCQVTVKKIVQQSGRMEVAVEGRAPPNAHSHLVTLSGVDSDLDGMYRINQARAGHTFVLDCPGNGTPTTNSKGTVYEATAGRMEGKLVFGHVVNAKQCLFHVVEGPHAVQTEQGNVEVPKGSVQQTGNQTFKPVKESGSFTAERLVPCTVPEGGNYAQNTGGSFSSAACGDLLDLGTESVVSTEPQTLPVTHTTGFGSLAIPNKESWTSQGPTQVERSPWGKKSSNSQEMNWTGQERALPNRSQWGRDKSLLETVGGNVNGVLPQDRSEQNCAVGLDGLRGGSVYGWNGHMQSNGLPSCQWRSDSSRDSGFHYRDDSRGGVQNEGWGPRSSHEEHAVLMSDNVRQAGQSALGHEVLGQNSHQIGLLDPVQCSVDDGHTVSASSQAGLTGKWKDSASNGSPEQALNYSPWGDPMEDKQPPSPDLIQLDDTVPRARETAGNVENDYLTGPMVEGSSSATSSYSKEQDRYVKNCEGGVQGDARDDVEIMHLVSMCMQQGGGFVSELVHQVLAGESWSRLIGALIRSFGGEQTAHALGISLRPERNMHGDFVHHTAGHCVPESSHFSSGENWQQPNREVNYLSGTGQPRDQCHQAPEQFTGVTPASETASAWQSSTSSAHYMGNASANDPYYRSGQTVVDSGSQGYYAAPSVGVCGSIVESSPPLIPLSDIGDSEGCFRNQKLASSETVASNWGGQESSTSTGHSRTITFDEVECEASGEWSYSLNTHQASNKREEPAVEVVRMELREYQREAVDLIRQGGNFLLCSPTGSGKTLIFAEAARNCLVNKKGRRVFFLVPTIHLTTQQCKVLKRAGFEHDGFRVGAFSGGMSFGQSQVQEHSMLVMTYDFFLNKLSDGLIRFDDVGMIIFDEVHNAIGDSASVKIMKKYKELPWGQRENMQIVGGTASPTRGPVPTVAYQKLHDLLDTLTVPQRNVLIISEDNEEISRVVPKAEEVIIPVTPRDSDKAFLSETEKFVVKAVNLFYDFVGKNSVGDKVNVPPPKSSENLDQKMSNWKSNVDRKVDSAVGMHDLLKKDLKYSTDLISAVSELRKEVAELGYSFALRKVRDVIDNRGYLGHSTASLFADLCRRFQDLPAVRMMSEASGISKGGGTTYDCGTLPRFTALLQLLSGYRNCSDFHCIVFIRTKQAVHEILNMLEGAEEVRFMEFMPFVGHGVGGDRSSGKVRGMTPSRQNTTVEWFRKPGCRGLVATAALEEGLDVPSCELVVRYSSTQTCIERVQGRGRARKIGSKYVNIVEEGSQEERLLQKSIREEESMKLVLTEMNDVKDIR